MSEIQQFVNTIPPVTRVLTLTMIVTSGLVSLGIVDVSYLVAYWPFIVHKWQFWRLFTGFFVPHPQPMQGMMQIYMTYSFSRGLEEGKFHSFLPDYLYYVMLVVPLILLLTSQLMAYSLAGALLSSITLTWSLANHDSLVNFYFMNIKASLLPAVSIGFRLLLEGRNEALVHLAGMCAGYIYNCIETKSSGPLGGFLLDLRGKDTNVHPNRVGTLNSTNSQWLYSTGYLPAPQWLRNLVTKVTGKNYAVGRRQGYTVLSSGSTVGAPGATGSTSGFLKNAFEKSAFKGRGQRLGT